MVTSSNKFIELEVSIIHRICVEPRGELSLEHNVEIIIIAFHIMDWGCGVGLQQVCVTLPSLFSNKMDVVEGDVIARVLERRLNLDVNESRKI